MLPFHGMPNFLLCDYSMPYCDSIDYVRLDHSFLILMTYRCTHSDTLMGSHPHWWVASVLSNPCNWVIILTKPTLAKIACNQGAQILSFMSVQAIILSPSSCHCLSDNLRSSKTAFLGQTSLFNFASPRICCWYVVVGPFDLQGRYIKINWVHWLVGQTLCLCPAPLT